MHKQSAPSTVITKGAAFCMFWRPSSWESTVKTVPAALAGRGYIYICLAYSTTKWLRLSLQRAREPFWLWAVWKGVYVQDVFQSASWANGNTFAHFYILDFMSTTVAYTVLPTVNSVLMFHSGRTVLWVPHRHTGYMRLCGICVPLGGVKVHQLKEDIRLWI